MRCLWASNNLHFWIHCECATCNKIAVTCIVHAILFNGIHGTMARGSHARVPRRAVEVKHRASPRLTWKLDRTRQAHRANAIRRCPRGAARGTNMAGCSRAVCRGRDELGRHDGNRGAGQNRVGASASSDCCRWHLVTTAFIASYSQVWEDDVACEYVFRRRYASTCWLCSAYLFNSINQSSINTEVHKQNGIHQFKISGFWHSSERR